jgi:hypothetical protein
MLLEIAKPVALLLCILSLYGVFYTAFLVQPSDLEQRIWNSLELLSIAAGICLVSGLIFREPIEAPNDRLEVEWRAWRQRWKEREGWEDAEEHQPERLMDTLPMRLFCWASVLMVFLFVASWYLETYVVFYRDVRRF